MATAKVRRSITDIVKEYQESNQGPLRHLDIGAGRGGFTSHLRDACGLDTVACDFHTERFAPVDIPITQVNINADPLPYPDASFDLVTSVEVVEHLEDYARLLREAHRVLKPGGLAVVTTPNILNMNSRLSYLCTGFPQLFGPIRLKNDERYSTGSHITPVHYFFLVYLLDAADFTDIRLSTDKVQRSSLWKYLLFAPLLAAVRPVYLWRQKGRHLSPSNERFVRDMFSFRMLVSRTIILSARKPL